MTVRLRLTLLYGGLFLVSGLVLLVVTYLIFRNSTGVNIIVPNGSTNGTASQQAATELRFADLSAVTPTPSTRDSSARRSCSPR